MPITLDELKQALDPEKTTLVLGAGAAVPSGGPTGSQLAHQLWKVVAKQDPQSDDLLDTASILVHRYTRRSVVEAVVGALEKLNPTGGMLGIPGFAWRKLFTTNFDLLVERAYAKAGRKLVAIRSNFDFSVREKAPGTRLFKIHGCITQDQSLGDKSSMLLTEDDYAGHEKYRQILFSELTSSLYQGDVLILGQSLRDRHLAELVSRVLEAKKEGAPGAVYVLVYSRDDIKAPLLENRGARIAFGGLDEFIHAMSTAPKPSSEPVQLVGLLPASLLGSTFDARDQAGLQANTSKMFNGAPATYADIEAGTTFRRTRAADIVEQLTQGNALVVTLLGAAGVGKTTLARQVLHNLLGAGVIAWEHRTDFPFDEQPWLEVEAKLRAEDKRGVILLDECTRYLRQTNNLLTELAKIDDVRLRVVLTANASQWAPRIKSPLVFSRGTIAELSRLQDAEIDSLIDLVQSNPRISTLVQSGFKRLRREEQVVALRQKSSADMFVCMKHIFANESLDTILLAEFNDLDPALQQYYRYVAALEAVGMRVHRQMILRMLRPPVSEIAGVLTGLSGIVDEYDISPNEGIYGWSTRHLVIARNITTYKFAGLKEMVGLFDTIIDNINPAVPIELQSARDICDQEFGIGRLADAAERQRLYRKLITAVPGERIPWHRLIREMLDERNVDATEYVIRDAEEAVGADGPIDRYKVRLLFLRANATPRLSGSDRIAMLRKAYELAMRNTERHRWDKLGFYTLCDVAVELVGRGEAESMLNEAIEKLTEAAARILDPDMQRKIREYRQISVDLRDGQHRTR